MWQRRTFHECASELSAVSEDFRAAHTNRFGWDRSKRDRVMLDTSKRGVEVLRILALSIRSDQDFGLTNNDSTPVGAFRSKATQAEVLGAIHDYRPPYSQQSGYAPLGLRQALNKIAHADPTRSGFFADNNTHDLILSGANQGGTWIAAISLIDLCNVIKSIPDVRTRQ
ncbi:MAG: hypothetical protein AABN95_02335 [Acidobacteriota bacterium]